MQPNYYMPQGYRPYGYPQNANIYQQPMQMQQQPIQQQSVQQIMPQQSIGLQGRAVDAMDVVKAMDIPLEGSISYFPLTDGTAIVTKQLQMDGTSKTIIYKPIDEKEIAKIPKYITPEELKKELEKFDNKTIKEDIKSIRREIKDLARDIKDIEDRKD